MDWTLADIRGLVRSLTGKPSTQQVTNEVLNGKINHFYRNEFPVLTGMAEMVSWYTTTTAANVGEYPLDATMIAPQEPLWLDDGNGYQRIWLTHDRLLFFATYPPGMDSETSVPAAALFDAGLLYLRPIPDDAYSLKIPIMGKPQELSANDDAPIDPAWGYAIAVGTAMNIKVEDGDLEGAEALAPLLRSKLNMVVAKDIFANVEKRAYPSF